MDRQGNEICRGDTAGLCRFGFAWRVSVNAENQPHIHPMFQHLLMNRYWKRAIFRATGFIAGALIVYLSLEWLGFR